MRDGGKSPEAVEEEGTAVRVKIVVCPDIKRYGLEFRSAWLSVAWISDVGVPKQASKESLCNELASRPLGTENARY